MSEESLFPPARHFHAAGCDRLRRGACLVVIGIALSVIAGWALDYPLLKSVLPGAVAMKPNTAVALGLAAVSLLLFTGASAPARSIRSRISIAAAAAAMAIGLLTLVEHVTGHALGIDELLFRDDVRSASARYPAGRMAPISAFNFLTLGLALVLIHRRKTTLWAQALTGCAAFTSLLAIVGYLFGVETLYRSGNFTAVALNTALSFIALCTALWCATRDFGFMRLITGTGVSGIVVRRFGVAALVLPLVISWVNLQGRHRGWFEADFGEALFAVINVVIFALLIWLGAVSLRKSEAKEADILERLRCAHLELEDRVHERTEALETALAVNQQIMENSLDVICIIDAEGRFITVSAACEKLWGYAPAEVIGHRFMEFVHPDDHEKTTQTAMDIMVGHVVRDFENRYVRKDGSAVFMTWSVYWSPDDKLMFCVARDATARKRAEEALREAGEAAERANRAKSEFLANMSHEIRTPMNGILGMTELTLETELDHRQREYLGMVKTSAHALLGVINDILDFSKIEAGKLELEAIDFSLRHTITHMLKPLVMRAQQKGLELRTEIADDVREHLIGDPLRLRQILLNFTDNALKFTERGSVLIKVAAEAESGGEQRLHFSITDTGIGIPPEKQGVIFEAFAQVDGSTTRNYGGTGLGLAIVAQLVEQMRGKVWIESTPGEGSTFHFTACFGITPVLSSAAVQLAEAEEPEASRGRLRILLAEDNVINRTLATAILKKRGHSLVHAANGREAVAFARAERFDLIFMDVQMPEMDGFEATGQIRAMEAALGREHTFIVAMTAHAMKGDRERCLAAGMDDYLSKPLQRAELIKLLDQQVELSCRELATTL